MKANSRFVVTAAIAGLLAFVGDFLVTFVLGLFYPNYSHLKLVMSELGTYQSPVATWVSIWWMIFGILLVVFALGFQAVFARGKKAAVVVTVLIVLVGLGAGIGAGIFPMEPRGAENTLAGKLHGIFAGIGFLAVSFVPLGMLILFSRTRSPGFVGLSAAIFAVGILFFVLFIASEDTSTATGILSYPGLWQRLFLLNHYVYLSVFSIIMIRSSRRSASNG